MRNLSKLIVNSILALSVITGSSHLFAETQYIDDTLFVPLRSGEGLQFRIVHKGVKSGTKIEVLESNRQTGYSKVQTPDGTIGYMPTRFLTKEPIAKQLLSALSSELEKKKQQLDIINKEHDALKGSFETVSGSQEELLAENKKLSTELESIKAVSANALYLDERNKQLHETNEQLRAEVELLTTENQLLKDKSETNFMMIGAALVVLGAFLAMIIPMLKPTKKNDAWV